MLDIPVTPHRKKNADAKKGKNVQVIKPANVGGVCMVYAECGNGGILACIWEPSEAVICGAAQSPSFSLLVCIYENILSL